VSSDACCNWSSLVFFPVLFACPSSIHTTAALLRLRPTAANAEEEQEQGGQAVSNSMETAVVFWGRFSTRSLHAYHRRFWTSDWMAVRRCWQHFW